MDWLMALSVTPCKLRFLGQLVWLVHTTHVTYYGPCCRIVNTACGYKRPKWHPCPQTHDTASEMSPLTFCKVQTWLPHFCISYCIASNVTDNFTIRYWHLTIWCKTYKWATSAETYRGWGPLYKVAPHNPIYGHSALENGPHHLEIASDNTEPDPYYFQKFVSWSHCFCSANLFYNLNSECCIMLGWTGMGMSLWE